MTRPPYRSVERADRDAAHRADEHRRRDEQRLLAAAEAHLRGVPHPSGPMMFQAQKVIVKAKVARARFAALAGQVDSARARGAAGALCSWCLLEARVGASASALPVAVGGADAAPAGAACRVPEVWRSRER